MVESFPKSGRIVNNSQYINLQSSGPLEARHLFLGFEPLQCMCTQICISVYLMLGEQINHRRANTLLVPKVRRRLSHPMIVWQQGLRCVPRYR